MEDSPSSNNLDRDALLLHSSGRPGKLEVTPTKPMNTQRDLSLAYSPGVAAPCRQIARDPDLAYDYTAKGNLVAVVSNGSAVLGLGRLGGLASKPVMEGKSVLFKRFADVDSIDLELDTDDVDAMVNAVRPLAPSFGGINLEDIAAPECFMVEQRLRESMDIPVFHDDQHGTAIIAAAGLINAMHLTNRAEKDLRLVINGAGAAGIACAELVKAMGVPHDQVLLCDSKGVIHKDRTEGMNQWKSAHAADTPARTLTEALEGADVFFGLSVKGAVDQAMIQSMADKPIVFAMANPDPEITPPEVHAVCPDAIVATGRSDYNNQINNVLGFPYIFRGALDVRASTINNAMKVAAAQAIAALAREDVPDEVTAAYSGRRLRYGPEYIIPVPFDPRLIYAIPPAVARAAMDTGVARRPIIDMEAYRTELSARLDPTVASLQAISEHVKGAQRKVVFAEGEDERIIRAAVSFRNSDYGVPVLIGREDQIQETVRQIGLGPLDGVEIHNARLSQHTRQYTDFLYRRLQRGGFLYRDCQRLVNQDRNIFAACMVYHGDADAMVTGATRNYGVAYTDITRVLDPRPGEQLFGLTILVARGRTVFLADTTVRDHPTGAELADIAEQSAEHVRRMGHEPRVAFVSYSSFGNPWREEADVLREAVATLDQRHVSFEYDGEMNVAVALDGTMMRNVYPFCRLSKSANVLIMPGRDSASAAYQLVQKLGGGTVIGPLLKGLSKPAQIVSMDSTVSDIVHMGAIAAYDAAH